MEKGRIIALIIFFIVISGCAAYSYFNPIINWDIVPYAGSVYSLETGDIDLIHAKAYETVRMGTDSASFINLTASNFYRKEVYASAESFYQQLQFYRVKPLYIFCAYFLYKTGIPLVLSFKVIAIISYFGIAVICLVWLMGIFRGNSFAIWLAVLLSLSPFLLYLSSITTPDMLSAAVVFLSFYFLLQKKNVIASVSLLLIACLIRQDNIFTLALTGAAIFMYKGDLPKSSSLASVAAITAAVIAIALAQFWAGSYGWAAYFEHSFGSKLIYPAEYTGGFSLNTYLMACKTGLAQFRFDSFMTETLILAVTIYMKKDSLKNYKNDLELLILFSIIAAAAAHIIIYPSAEDRFFTAQYMIINIIFLKNIYEKFSGVKTLSL